MEVNKERLLVGVCLGHALVFLVLLLLMQFDQTQILGINRWIKPAKFAISIAIYTFTLACIMAPVPPSSRSASAARWIVAVSMIVEFVLIFLQAARGAPSHFNQSTPFNAIVFAIMGSFITANTVGVALILRDYVFRPPYLHPALITGIRAGLCLFLLGSLQGFMMVARNSHTVGAPDGGPGLPFVNWSTTHGDLRIPHFFALHALQALPMLALLFPSVTFIRGVASAWFIVFAGLLAWCFR